MFDTYGAQILAGRAFNGSDLGAANSVIVNRTFAQELIGNRGALGTRFRYSRGPASTPWYQIVGVVADFPAFSPAPGSDGEPTVYHAAAPGEVHPFTVSVRFAGAVPAGFIDRFRMLGAEIDPVLQLRRAGRLSQFYDDQRALWRHMAWALAGLTASVLLLSAAGIYALMSFTVAQRTREIGIRMALGERPGAVRNAVMVQGLKLIVPSLAIGGLAAWALSQSIASLLYQTDAADPLTFFLTVTLLLVVALAGCYIPARRATSVSPIAAIRAE